MTVVWMMVFFIYNTSHAQINLLVGYGLNFQPSDSHDALLREHNGQNDWYKNNFDNFGLHHGLYLGVRQGWSSARLVLSYRNYGSRLEAEGIPPGADQSFRRQLYFRNNVISLGLETAFERLNFGASLDYNFLKTSAETSDYNNSYVVQKDRYLSSHFYLNIDFHGQGTMGFTLQPFVSLGWTELDLEGLSDELSTSSVKRYTPTIFGVALILVNGPQ